MGKKSGTTANIITMIGGALCAGLGYKIGDVSGFIIGIIAGTIVGFIIGIKVERNE